MRIECKYSELVDIKALKEHPANENKHPDRQIEALAKIIAKNGMRSPIIVSLRSGFIVRGHGRKKALELLEWKKVPVEYQKYESELEEFNDRVADNEISRYAEFDADLFDANLESLGIDIADIELNEFGILSSNLTYDDDIEFLDAANVDEKVTFKVKCENMKDMAVIQKIFKITGDSVKFLKFMEILND